MKLVLDACVLFPTVMRECLLAVAARGLFTPLWSDRILGEWQRAAARFGPMAEAEALAAIARALVGFPRAVVKSQPGLEARLHLPDENDLHVLATAITGHADAIVTLNAKDFPRGTLAAEGLERRDPDGLLWELWSHHTDRVEQALEQVRATASKLSGEEKPLKPLLKRAKLTRLARAVTG
ncbi:RSP_2648 family PIN domain-containing protein [Pseudorhodobacter sp.]|uniref:RSP_2648 family PIN domain-containing protein n=1 Tax=Pseudorhodobacter sp. TaxID=1934400 RepID=UPI0026477334|nr:PIN domain-containing protein [Pseudorhodobacter sp.]MDN5786890.1 PIN domain-containing protein [Pseudorhodobacter sp.]